MPTLHELQSLFTAALLQDDAAALIDLVEPGAIGASERIAVHRNNVLVSLVDALADTFPAVQQLVDPRFFAYAATEFVRTAPPTQPCLASYGAGFPDFLADFPPCRDLSYLADVARLEWLLHQAAVAEDAAPLAPQVLAGIAPEDAPRLLLGLHPAVGLVASPWPIDAIWRANRRGAVATAEVDLDAGGVALAVTRQGTDILMRPLTPAAFAFRHSLHRGVSLAQAVEAALAHDAEFPLAGALSELFAEGAVVAVALAPPSPPMETAP